MVWLPARLLGVALLVALPACSGDARTRPAAESEALIHAEAPRAVAAAIAALGGSAPEGGAGWESCMAQPVWRYAGWARFRASHADWRGDLEQVRAALVRAGYPQVSMDRTKVYASRGNVVVAVGPSLAAKRGPPQWKVTFRAEPCARYTARERARIRERTQRPDPLDLGH